MPATCGLAIEVPLIICGFAGEQRRLQQFTIGLPDHHRRQRDPGRIATHRDRVARVVEHHHPGRAGGLRVQDLGRKGTCAAADQRDVSRNCGAVDQWATTLIAGRTGAVVDHHQRRHHRPRLLHRYGHGTFHRLVHTRHVRSRRRHLDAEVEHVVILTRADRGQPWHTRRRAGGLGCRAVVALGSGHEHAGVGGEQKRDVVRSPECRARTTDRVVDHIDTVCNRLVDGAHGIGREAAALETIRGQRSVPADLVGRNARPGRHAADPAEALTADLCRYPGVACRRRTDVAAVPVLIPGRQIFLRKQRRCGREPVHKEARREQLVVALEVGVQRIVGVVAERAVRACPACRWRAIRDALALVAEPGCRLVGEARVLRPDAAVDDADDDVLAGQPVAPRPATTGDVEVVRRVVGERMPQLVLPDTGDVRVGPQRLDLTRAKPRGEAIEAVAVSVDLLARPHLGHDPVVLLFQMSEVLANIGRVDVDLRPGGRFGGRDAGDAAAVGRYRVLAQLHDVDRGRLLGGQRSGADEFGVRHHADGMDQREQNRDHNGRMFHGSLLPWAPPAPAIGGRTTCAPCCETDRGPGPSTCTRPQHR